MLVLSRKTGDSIVIGENIHVEVLQVKGNQIRIGILAPKNLRVLRGELVSVPKEQTPAEPTKE